MKRTGFLSRFRGFILIAPLSLLLFSASCSKDDDIAASSRVPQTKEITAVIPGVLDSSEIQTLTLLREEELLAMDVYLYCKGLYNKPIFKNIAQSELSHTNAVRKLLLKYGIPDPGANHQAGVFTNPDYQALYNSLTAQAAQSLEQAYYVGATIEDMDIYDIMQHIQHDVDNPDILKVLNNLLNGSKNHLRSFNKQLLALNIIYTPQFISPQLFAWIIAGH